MVVGTAQYHGGFSHIPFEKIALPLGALAIMCVVDLVGPARRLLEAGHRFDDVRAALRADAESRREEANLPAVAPHDEPASSRVATWRAGSVLAMITGALLIGLARRDPMWVFAGLPLLGAGTIVVRRLGARPPQSRPNNVLARWYDRLWEGRFGAWFFAAVAPSWRARASTAPAAASTEVLLARSAEEHLDALPHAARSQLDPRRHVIDRLREQIENLRAREDELAAAVAEAGRARSVFVPGVAGASDRLIERRVALAEELEHVRAEVARQRASAVAALDNIRLQLLRVRAGVGSAHDLTSDLEAARHVERQISAMIEVHRLTSDSA